MSNDVEEVYEGFEEELDEPEEVIVLPAADSGYVLYVCEVCGSELTEIPAYNRFLCEYCGLHY